MSRKIITGGSLRGEFVDGHTTPTESADSSLWEYALRVYAHPEVAAACLEAQDMHGVDVNLLLCAAWCAARGIPLDEVAVRDLDEQCRSWREQVIVPIRRQRRLWKDDEERGEDYAAIKRLELAAEREQLERLELRLAGQGCGQSSARIFQCNFAAVFDGRQAAPVLTERLSVLLHELHSQA